MPTSEQLTQRVATLEETVRELEDQNAALRKSALAFGALAERLNARLADRRVSSRLLSRTRVWVVLDRVVAQVARLQLRHQPAAD
jgi:hypothetical protein